MDKFEDFIKKNTEFKGNSTQEELDKIKSTSKSFSFNNLKVLFASLTLTFSLLAGFFIMNTNKNESAKVSDLTLEQYMVEVFLAVDAEVSDAENNESDFL
jgi:hypothetical protein